MIKRITEIGVVVKSLTGSGDRLHEILGARGGTVLKAQEYGMVAQMFRIGNIEFELMEPANQDGLIAQFLEKRGEGLHHIAFEVEDINGNLFGEARLQSSIQNQLYKAPDQMLDEILSEVNRFAATGEFNDDVCVVSMHVKKALA